MCAAVTVRPAQAPPLEPPFEHHTLLVSILRHARLPCFFLNLPIEADIVFDRRCKEVFILMHPYRGVKCHERRDVPGSCPWGVCLLILMQLGIGGYI